jgi:hypothetical protein
LLRVLDGKPYGQDIIDQAKDHLDNESDLQFLLLLSSEANKEDVPKLLDKFKNRGLADLYMPLAQ